MAANLPFIPEYITVHLGPPSSPAQNVTVSFPDYIKNVASSEIYPTWPENAIRANIYAQISYALNRIYTEWYPSQGYDFDITNSTAYDQAFTPGRNIFENISEIVDDIFNNYLTKGDSVAPFFAQYCNGTTVTCEGLSQWGTVPLAEAGMTPYEILTHFYGDDINIVQNAPVSPNLGTYPGTALKLGMVGEDVRTIQKRLNRISTNYPAIPKIYPVNSIFDKTTEDAVKEFQRIFNLTQDGIVGKSTWYKIAYIYNSVKQLSELESEGLTLNEVSRIFPEVLKEGQSGAFITLLQYLLNVIATYYEAVPPITESGYFGADTKDTVIQYQKLFGLTPDGIVGKETWDSIIATYQKLYTSYEDILTKEGVPLYPGRLLVVGSSGEDVRELQEFINYISTIYPEIPELPVTGYYGEMTRDAIYAIQALFGLDQTGFVGPLTWDTIAREYAMLKESSEKSPGQYPGYEIGGEV